MSVTITKESENLFVTTIKGVFTYDDQKEVEKHAGNTNLDQKVKILVLAEEFSGWGKEGDWGDLTFMYEHDAQIEKIAVVAEDKWKDQILMFLGAGRRQAAVEFFLPGETQAARDWLQSESQ
ncbi:MAG: STAS/SEC14 domain-containing protein [Phycisphaerales bacterium]|nr:MAG: STAS/SEC14 domain-containing protein [Phycisphaerales bacterium]